MGKARRRSGLTLGLAVLRAEGANGTGADAEVARRDGCKSAVSSTWSAVRRRERTGDRGAASGEDKSELRERDHCVSR